MRKYIDAARVAGRKNLDGRLVVRPTAGLPFLLSEGMEVHLVPPVVDAPRRVVVQEASELPDGSAVVRFDLVGDAHVADALVGCHCLVARDDVDAEALAAHDLATGAGLEGWAFEDAASGRCGTVLRVDEMPGQMLLAVSLEGEDGRERLVPLVDEFVESVDEDARALGLRLPAGIFDL